MLDANSVSSHRVVAVVAVAVAAVVAYHLWLPQYCSHVEASRIMSLVWESEAARNTCSTATAGAGVTCSNCVWCIG